MAARKRNPGAGDAGARENDLLAGEIGSQGNPFLPKQQAPRVGNYFGGCPECGGTDGFLNIGPEHWFICHAHMMKWRAGSNLFSCWRYETEEHWRRNAEILGGCIEVEPLPMNDGCGNE